MPKETPDGTEKTEQPTSRKIGKARSEGNVARSQEANSAAVLLAGIIVLIVFGGWVMQRLTGMMKGVYWILDEVNIDLSNIQGYFAGAAFWILYTLLPFFLIIMLVGLAINFLQFGFIWSTKGIQPKLDKLSPTKGLKNLINQKSAVKLLVNIVKVVVVSYIAFSVVKRTWPSFFPLMDASVGAIFLFLVRTILEVVLWVLGALIIIAIIDFIYQKWKHQEGLKMTKQEVKDEHKMMEGDPKVKAQIRQRQFQLAFNTMIRELPNADVVVTNPVNVAVALKYDSEAMAAPRVIGKGLRKLADRIKQIALEKEIPIVENPPLARALFKSCEIGDEIPGQFYQDVAEILAQIYKLQDSVNTI